MAQKRKLMGLLVQPEKQFRFAIITLLALFIYCLFLMGFIWWITNAQSEFIAIHFKSYLGIEAEIVELDSDMLIDISLIFMYFATMTWLIMFRTHQIYGPMIRIEHFIKELTCGNYQGRLTLRKNDEFQELAEDLNKLAISLQEKKEVFDEAKN